jgi:proton-coupled amino acid transporter
VLTAQSTVITRAICDYLYPGMLTTNARRYRPALKWGIVSTSILAACGVIALLIPFFSDLMNIWSSVGIFTLSFAVPSGLYMMANRGELSRLAVFVNTAIIVLALVGGGLGVWAAIADILNKWAHSCFHFDLSS